MRIASPTGSTTQTLAESNGNSLPIVRLTGLEPDKTLHEIERHTVDFDRKHTGTTLEPLAPARSVTGALLPRRQFS